MKKMLSLLALSMPALVYCVEASPEEALPGTELFYRHHPPVYHYGSNAPLVLNETDIQIKVNGLITTEKVMPYLPFSQGSPSLPFVGYLQSPHEIDLEITVNKDGKQLKFHQVFATPTSAQQPTKFSILSQSDGLHQNEYTVQGEIKRVMITWWNSLFETKDVVAYEISINDFKETIQSPQATHKEPSIAATKAPEVATDTIQGLSADYYVQHPLVYGTTHKTLSFMDKDVPAEIMIQTLINQDNPLECGNFSSAYSNEEFLGLLADKDKTIVAVRVPTPVGVLMFFDDLTVLAQEKGVDNYLTAKDENGREYKLQVFAAKDTVKASGNTSMVSCYHIAFGDKVNEVVTNAAVENKIIEVAATDVKDTILGCLEGFKVADRDEIGKKVKAYGYVLADPNIVKGHGKGYMVNGLAAVVQLARWPGDDTVPQVKDRIGSSHAAYMPLGLAHWGQGGSSIVPTVGEITRYGAINLDTRRAPIRIGNGRHNQFMVYITPTEIDFNMTPGPCSTPTYEKVRAYIVTIGPMP